MTSDTGYVEYVGCMTIHRVIRRTPSIFEVKFRLMACNHHASEQDTRKLFQRDFLGRLNLPAEIEPGNRYIRCPTRPGHGGQIRTWPETLHVLHSPRGYPQGRPDRDSVRYSQREGCHMLGRRGGRQVLPGRPPAGLRGAGIPRGLRIRQDLRYTEVFEGQIPLPQGPAETSQMIQDARQAPTKV